MFVDGKVITLTDYKALQVHDAGIEERLEKRAAGKGHKQELEAFAHALREDGYWPIPLWQQIQATGIALQVEAKIRPDFI